MNFIPFIIGFAAGVIGAMGLGGGAVLLIYLSVFAAAEQLNAQGINLLFFIPIGTLAVIIYAVKKQIKWKTVLTSAAVALIGAAAGVLLSGKAGGEITAKIFAGVLIITGLREIFPLKHLISRAKYGMLKKE